MTRADPPYLRIVADLRRRITSGVLRPGDRVPSARQLTRDWQVAVATATRALAVLQQEGLTTVRPGVGTVVAGDTAAPPAPRQPVDRPASRAGDIELTRQRIVRCAIDLADTHGMAEVSMRRIAAELGTATMSIYRHVPSKDDLLAYMIDETLAEEPLPDTPPAGWRARLEVCARTQWSLFRRHPWLAPAMSLTRPQLAPSALRHTEWVLAALEGSGMTLADRMYAHLTLFSFVRGVATALEPENEAQRDTGMNMDEWMDEHSGQLWLLAASGGSSALTLLRLLAEDDFDMDLDRLFEFGLARLLDGVAGSLRQSRQA